MEINRTKCSNKFPTIVGLPSSFIYSEIVFGAAMLRNKKPTAFSLLSHLAGTHIQMLALYQQVQPQSLHTHRLAPPDPAQVVAV